MKKLPVIVLLFFISCFNAYSQFPTDSIVTTNSAFLYRGMPVKLNQMVFLMRSNPEAYHYMKKAKGNHDAGVTFTVIGGFLVGYPLGEMMRGYHPHWGMAGAGLGVLLIFAVPFNVAYKDNLDTALELYNSRFRKNGSKNISLSLGIRQGGIGLVGHFYVIHCA